MNDRSEPGRFVRVTGVRYRCCLRFSAAKGLGRLASFFYEKVLPVEHRIDKIISSFGLPPRVIEDVLIELLRKHYAWLDLSRGVIMPADDPIERKDVDPQHDRSIEVWQDDVSGGMLPMDLLDGRFQAPDKSAHVMFLKRTADEEIKWFMDAADARILAALRSADRDCVKPSNEQQLEWDSIVEKEKLGRHDIYLKVMSSVIEDAGHTEKLEIVYAPDLPWWFPRMWTSALRSQAGEKAVTDSAISLAQAEQALLDASFLEVATGESRVLQWFASWRNAVTRTPPRTDQESATLESNHRRQLARDLSSSQRSTVSFTEAAGAASHLAQQIGDAKRLVVIFSPLTESTVAEVIHLVESNPRSPHLLLIDTSGTKANLRGTVSHVPNVSYYGVRSEDGTLAPNCCFVDDEVVFFATLDVLLSTAHVLRLAGKDLTRELFQISRDACCSCLPSLRQVFANIATIHSNSERQKARESHPEVMSEPAALAAIGKLRAIEDRYREALALYERELYQSQERDVDEAEDEERNQSALSVEARKFRNLLTFDPELVNQAQDIRYELSEICLQRPFISTHYAVRPVDWIVDVINTVKRGKKQHEITFFVSTSAELFTESSIATSFRQVVALGNTLRFVASPVIAGTELNKSLVGALEQLVNSLGGYRATVHECKEPLPDGLLVDLENTFVFVHCPLANGVNPPVVMSIDSAAFAESLKRIAGLS